MELLQSETFNIPMECDRKNIFLSTKQTENESKQSRFIRKVMGSFRRHLRAKEFLECNLQTQEIFTENHTAILDKECEQISGSLQSTVDSGVGVNTFKEETSPKQFAKRISFAVEDKVIEIEKYQPKFYDLEPRKCVAHITETPKMRTADLVVIHSSTPLKLNDELTPDIIREANLIRESPWKPEYVSELPETQNTFVRSPSCRSEDKFIVNLFESRQSTRMRRRGICLPNFDITEASNGKSEVQPKPERQETIIFEPRIEQALNDNVIFLKLKKQRDVECARMVQASNILKIIRKNPRRDWSDELLAEKLLLETDEKCKLIINKIRDLGYSNIKNFKPDHRATITLSNLEFSLTPEENQHLEYYEFFVITLSHETELLMSQVRSANVNKLTFDEKFTFANVNSDFTLTVKLFSIRIPKYNKKFWSIFKKKATLCPMSKIYYEDLSTQEMKETTVLNPNFNCIGEFTFNKFYIGRSHFILSKMPCDSKVSPGVSFSLVTDNLKITSNLSGFLTLGVPNKQNEVLYWERKWCVLRGIRLFIYNYPYEEEFGEAIFSIDLEYCLTPLSMNVVNMSRKRTFLLKTGRPRAIRDENNVVLKNKSNFVVQKYLFAADSNHDFKLWTSDLQSILDCLRDWQQLVLADDEY